jgi:hypothetical protein
MLADGEHSIVVSARMPSSRASLSGSPFFCGTPR